jgi:predicted ferric reductase
VNDAPFLWFVNRSTGVVLLVLLTVTLVLGVLSFRGRAGRTVPAFVPQVLHRNLALLSVAAVAAHVTTAVVDGYVDIRWWQALVPFGGTYQPLWLGLGALSLDLVVVVVLTSLLRRRLGLRVWRAVHLLSWLAWGAAVAHGVGIGTDVRAGTGWALWPTLACCAAVAAALVARVVLAARAPTAPLGSTR